MFTLRLRTVSLLTFLFVCATSASAISGRVVEDHSGNALASPDIRVIRGDGSELAAEFESDSNGYFEAPSLSAGDYRLEVSKPNYLSTTLQVRAIGGSASPLLVRLIRCGVISGRVFDSQNQAVRSATVFALSRFSDHGPLRPFARFESGHETRVNENGEYRLFNLPPGQYAVGVTYGASTAVVGSTGGSEAGSAGSGALFYPANSAPQLFTFSGGEEYHDIDFALIPSALFRVSGKIDLATPQSGFWLALTLQNQPTFATAVTRANEDGSFHFEGIPPGSYFLFATGPSHGRGPFGASLDEHTLFGRTTVEVAGDVDGLAIAMQKGRSSSLLLRNRIAEGHPCSSNMQIRISSLEDWGADLERTLTAGFEKPARLDNLAPSRYLLTGKEDGADCYPTNETILDLTGGSENGTTLIPVAPKGTIRGRLAADKQRMSQWSIVLLPAFATGNNSLLRSTFADSEARFAFERLPPGRYRIAVRATDDLSQRWLPDLSGLREIEVKPGVTTDVELSLPSPDQSPKE